MTLPGTETAAAAGESRRTAAIRRSMVRTMTAAVVILAGVAGLAVAAVVMAVRAGKHQERAEAAEWQSHEQLWRSLLDQASALRLHGSLSRRADGMEALRKAVTGHAALHPLDRDGPDVVQMRDEAAGLLALPLVTEATPAWPLPGDQEVLSVDAVHGLLASAPPSGASITVRNLKEGSSVQELPISLNLPPDSLLSGLAWRPSSLEKPAPALLAAWFKNGSMGLWSLPAGKQIFTWVRPAHPYLDGGPPQLGFSADGRYFAWFDRNEGPISIFDLNAGKKTPHAIKSRRTAFALRPHATEIAIVAGSEVLLMDFSTGAQKESWPVSAAVTHLQWSRDGRLLAAMQVTGQIVLWNMDGTEKYVLNGHTGQGRALAFSADGRTLMSSARDSTTRWWDTARGQLLLTSTAGCGLDLTPDGRGTIFEGNDHSLGHWEVSPSPVFATLPMVAGRSWDFRCYDLSRDGKWFAGVTPAGIQLIDLDRPDFRSSIISASMVVSPLGMVLGFPSAPPAITGLTFEPNGGLLLTTDGVVLRRMIGTIGGAAFLTPGTPPVVPVPEGLSARTATTAADGHTVLVEFTNYQAGLADLSGARPFVMLGERQGMGLYTGPGSVTGAGRMAVSGDGKFVAFGYGMGKGLCVFEAATGKTLHAGTSGALVTFSPDSSRLVVGTVREATMLRTADWSRASARSIPGQTIINSGAAFTRDGHLLALAVSPQILQLCHGADMTPHVTLTPPVLQGIRACRMAEDGSRLLGVTSSNEVQIWNVRALRRELAALDLDWNDDAPPAPAALAAPRPPASSAWMLALGLVAATLAAAAAAVFLLRKHRGLIRDYASAEALVQQQQQDLERANAGLIHSEKMKALGTLAAGMAHDFNNLLSVIRMSGKLIGREAPDNSEITEHVNAIEHAVLQGKQVARSMLGYSRSGPGDGQPINVATVVDDAVVLLSTEFLSGIALTLEMDRDTPPVAVPAGRIEQILLNLVVNASEAMNGRGSLTITVRTAAAPPPHGFILPPQSAAPWVEICVRDSGPGIPPELASRIFEPFFTTKNAGNQRGTGLGLSMVHTVAEQDGMGLSLASTPGQGAAFSVYLPRTGSLPTAAVM